MTGDITWSSGTIYTSDGTHLGSCTVDSNGFKVSYPNLSIGYSKGSEGNMRGLYKAYIVMPDDEIQEVGPFLSYEKNARAKAVLMADMINDKIVDALDDCTIILQRLGDAPECDKDDDE